MIIGEIAMLILIEGIVMCFVLPGICPLQTSP